MVWIFRNRLPVRCWERMISSGGLLVFCSIFGHYPGLSISEIKEAPRPAGGPLKSGQSHPNNWTISDVNEAMEG